MKKKKPIIVIEVKIKGEIYNRVYGVKDIKNVVNLFNEIHRDGMEIRIVQVLNKKRMEK